MTEKSGISSSGARKTAAFFRLAAVVFLAFLSSLAGCSGAAEPDPVISPQPGQLARGEDTYGVFYTYTPESVGKSPEILVLVHGTPQKNDPDDFFARLYATVWQDFAEERGLVLVAPAFNQRDFSSRLGNRALGGYRGLFGREIGADAWVLRLVKAHQEAFGLDEAPFYLYGHSAGGQFTARFVVTHPGRVKRAVITSAATYPQPDPGVAWPFGLGALDTQITWDDGSATAVDFTPDRGAWLAATRVPLTVIVGLNDTAELPAELIPGQKGRNRFVIGENWVRDMAAFAAQGGLESRIELAVIPGIGHSMTGLLPYSQAALAPE